MGVAEKEGKRMEFLGIPVSCQLGVLGNPRQEKRAQFRQKERRGVLDSYFPCEDPSPHKLTFSFLTSFRCIQKHSTCPLLFDLTQLIFNRLSFHRFLQSQELFRSRSSAATLTPLLLLHEHSQIGKRLVEPDRQNANNSLVFLLMCTRWGLL